MTVGEFFGGGDRMWELVIVVPLFAAATAVVNGLGIAHDPHSVSRMSQVIGSLPALTAILVLALPVGFYGDVEYLEEQGMDIGLSRWKAAGLGVVPIPAVVTAHVFLRPEMALVGDLLVAAVAVAVCGPYLKRRNDLRPVA